MPAAYVAEHVDLGYATTAHRAQGITVDTSHTLADPATSREALYVAMTRGRDANHAYLTGPGATEDCHPEPRTGTQDPGRVRHPRRDPGQQPSGAVRDRDPRTGDHRTAGRRWVTRTDSTRIWTA